MPLLWVFCGVLFSKVRCFVCVRVSGLFMVSLWPCGAPKWSLMSRFTPGLLHFGLWCVHLWPAFLFWGGFPGPTNSHEPHFHGWQCLLSPTFQMQGCQSLSLCAPIHHYCLELILALEGSARPSRSERSVTEGREKKTRSALRSPAVPISAFVSVITVFVLAQSYTVTFRSQR